MDHDPGQIDLGTQFDAEGPYPSLRDSDRGGRCRPLADAEGSSRGRRSSPTTVEGVPSTAPTSREGTQPILPI